MTFSRRDFLKLSGATVMGVGLGAHHVLDRGDLAWAKPSPALATNDPALHLLNRITWGARPEEVERARIIGVESYLDEQLNPHIIDDSLVDEKLKHMPVLFMKRKDGYALTDYYSRCARALVEGMILRASQSRRQLLERMVEFWADHFNAPHEDYLPDMVDYQHTVIRQNALGKFKDILFASAKHPAMLYYLDNFLNIAEHPNENYARELLELHTLGVDGGYTEADVKAVARAFTGWTVHDGVDDGFYFDMDSHDTQPKTILGHELPADRGIEDGLHVLQILASHPATAQFLSRKLCIRFVSDTPPQSLVDSTAQVWMQTGGDIKPVLRHIFTSTEFYESAGQKLRRPLDFFIGALRATGTQYHDWWTLYEGLSYLSQVPYSWFPPDGYPDIAEAWTSTNGLLSRWNGAMYLTHDAYSNPDVPLSTHLHERIGNPATVGEAVQAVARQVFGAEIPDEIALPFIEFMADGNTPEAPFTNRLKATRLASLYGLMLASPHFQWR